MLLLPLRNVVELTDQCITTGGGTAPLIDDTSSDEVGLASMPSMVTSPTVIEQHSSGTDELNDEIRDRGTTNQPVSPGNVIQDIDENSTEPVESRDVDSDFSIAESEESMSIEESGQSESEPDTEAGLATDREEDDDQDDSDDNDVETDRGQNSRPKRTRMAPTKLVYDEMGVPRYEKL